MCFGGGGNKQQQQPPPPAPGILNVSKVEPDPSQAWRYRGEDVGTNTSGRYGGGLLVDAAAKGTPTPSASTAPKPKATLGGM